MNNEIFISYLEPPELCIEVHKINITFPDNYVKIEIIQAESKFYIRIPLEEFLKISGLIKQRLGDITK